MSSDHLGQHLGHLRQRPVVVGYNGKPHARAALAWAAEEAARRQAPLVVMNAANYPGMALGPAPGLLDPSPRGLEADEEVTAGGVAEVLALQPRLHVSGVTLATAPADTLVDAAASAGLLVVGSRGFGRALAALLGSVAFSVAARAPCPVVVVRSGGRSRQAGTEVVVGYDGSPEATAALRFAADHAAATSSGLLIVTATGENAAAGDGSDRRLLAGRNVAEEGRDTVRRTHPRLGVVTAVEDARAGSALVSASAAARLVVVGTRGRGAFRGMLLGSVSQAVIGGARCPVAVIGTDPLALEDGDAAGRVVGDREVAVVRMDLVEVWGHGSFPASDPPANW
jgi:nucleotide-binding universal stress UspA family protein